MQTRSPVELIVELDRDALVRLMSQLLHEHPKPELTPRIQAKLVGPSAPFTKDKSGKQKQKADQTACRLQVHGILHSLDGMRSPVAYGYVSGLTSQLCCFMDDDAPIAPYVKVAAKEI